MADNSFGIFSGGVPESASDETQALAEKYLPTQPPPERLFASNPQTLSPELAQIPEALRPNEIASTVPAPEQLMQVPVGTRTVDFSPQVQRAPTQESQVDPSQFAKQPAAQVAPQEQPIQMPQEAVAALNTYNTQQKATAAIANAMAQKSALEQISLAEQEDQFKAGIEKQQKLQSEFDSEHKQKVADLESINKQLAGQDFTTAKIDKDRLWSNMGTGQKILAGIALMLGGATGGATGKSNMAMDVINKAIDRDIEEQKANIQTDVESKKMKSQNLRDQAGLQQNMLSNLRAKFGNDLQAESALRILMAQQTQNKFAQIAAGTNSKVVKENANIAIAQFEREKQVAAQAFKAQVAQQKLLQNMGNQDLSNLNPAQMAMLPEDIRKQVESSRERSVPGFIGQTKDKEAATAFQKEAAGSVGAIEAVKQLQAFTKGGMNWSPEKRAQAATQLQLVIGKLREPLLGPGTMQEKEYDRLMEAIGNPDAWFSYGNAQRARLNLILKNLENDIDAKAGVYGLRRRPQSSVPMRSY
ncbi:MAG: hypothetical protein ACAH17_00075 [Candidatus Paceibacterota bacterium]